MKRTIFVLTTVLFFALSLFSCKKDETNNNGGGGTYVNLGLPSGTKWKSTNETGGNNGYYTHEEAVSAFGDKLPTKEQQKELIDKCLWEIQDDNSYKVSGPNGNSIILPAAGYRRSDGAMFDVGEYGQYWSSTLEFYDDASGYNYFWYLSTDSDEFGLYLLPSVYGNSVRLVQK